MNHKIAVFPGSFDPVTLGHVDIMQRVLSLFDKIYVVIGINGNKVPLFSVEQRMEWLKAIFRNESRVAIAAHRGLTIDFCKQVKAGFIVRGLRNSTDYCYERELAQVNRDLCSDIETLFITSTPQYAHLSSSMIRELIQFQADVSPYLPDIVRF
ncbi:MAG: pantetheine-phosphate adenylyltransferase [Bacteroidales bacterium]|jgi:pantetheine-phosphate adenylyltransferase|nr:pantetheine-phosphate adenylyltransferase [Bacteroidales bacterium]